MAERRDVIKSMTMLYGVGLLSEAAVNEAAANEEIKSVDGDITDENPTDSVYSDYHTDPINFEGSAGDEIRIELTMPNADPWIRMVAPDSTQVMDTSESETTTELFQSGEYTIYPQAYPQNVPGPYSLTIILLSSNDSGTEQNQFPISFNSVADLFGTITREITSSDPTDPVFTAFHTEPISYQASSGDKIDISLSMPDASPWIRIQGPNGGEIFSDSTGNISSLELPNDGEYVIYPQSYPEQVPGEYTLQITESAAFPDVSPDPAYRVETEPLAANPTRAIFEIEIVPDPENSNFSDFELGTVSGLEFEVSGMEGLQISRALELPTEEGSILKTSGSVLISAAGLLPGIGQVIGFAELASNTIELAQELEEADEDPTNMVFTGEDPVIGTPTPNGVLPSRVRYLIEVEATETPVTDSDSEFVNGWSDTFSFYYTADPSQPPSSTDIPEKMYSADVVGGLLSDNAFSLNASYSSSALGINETTTATRSAMPPGKRPKTVRQDKDNADDPPQDQTQRVLQIAGKSDPSELTLGDVTATITRFNRGQSVNGVTVTQDDVTWMITLFNRN